MSYLLKNSILLIHGDDKHTVIPTQKDILIIGDQIARIFPPWSPPDDKELSDARIIDCSNKIISPGFIDTHHHVWQTQSKGRHANEGLFDYMITGNFMSSQDDPDDVYIGQIGCLWKVLMEERQHAHVNNSKEHSQKALDATIASGIRSVFCYPPTGRVAKWDMENFEIDPDWFPPWVMETYNELASHSPYADGRVQIGFAFDGWFLPKEFVIDIMQKVRAQNPKVVTCHYVRTPWNSPDSTMDDYGILGPEFIISHANAPDEKTRKSDAEKLKKYNAHTSSTPDTELQMGHGDCVCFDKYHAPFASLGSDCHSNNSSDMLSAMRLALQNARGVYNSACLADWKVPSRPVPDVVEALNLATIKGAEAIGMADEIGTLEEGKKADVLIFDGLSPGMVCAAEEDPIAAVVLHASVRDIETVFVDGKIRKEGGKLKPIQVSGIKINGKDGEVNWMDVARELVTGRKKINEKITKLNLKNARQILASIRHLEEDAVVIPVEKMN